jgi:hypothetical protein
MCRCSDCFGLREFMVELTGNDHGLEPAGGHVEAQACSGLLDCDCDRCERERARFVRDARLAARPRQPWEPKRRAA